MTREELDNVLAKHVAWLNCEEGGECADLSGANLGHADLRYANLHYANLREAYLGGANLSDADLSYANLSDADLHEANLSDADLSGADLSGAGLRGANMVKSVLGEANLSDADLSYADLREADLRRANLSGAKMGYDAYFTSSYGQPIYQCSCGFSSRNATLTLYANGSPEKWLFYTGCFTGTEPELRAAIKEQHGGTSNEYRYKLAIDYLLSVANSNREEEALLRSIESALS